MPQQDPSFQEEASIHLKEIAQKVFNTFSSEVQQWPPVQFSFTLDDKGRIKDFGGDLKDPKHVSFPRLISEIVEDLNVHTMALHKLFIDKKQPSFSGLSLEIDDQGKHSFNFKYSE